MKVFFSNDFLKKYSKLKDKNLSARIANVVSDIESANSISGIKNVKNLRVFPIIFAYESENIVLVLKFWIMKFLYWTSVIEKIFTMNSPDHLLIS